MTYSPMSVKSQLTPTTFELDSKVAAIQRSSLTIHTNELPAQATVLHESSLNLPRDLLAYTYTSIPLIHATLIKL